MMSHGRLAASAVLLPILLAGLLTSCSSENGSTGAHKPITPGDKMRARVTRVIDGDTIEVALAEGPEYVRYIGIDTPETVDPDENKKECYGTQASEFNHELVNGETVRLVFDRELRDVYGRLLAYVYVGDRFVNAALVRDGYARTLEIPPNTARAELLRGFEQRADERSAGLWGACRGM